MEYTKNVLVVDDDKESFEIVEVLLERLNFKAIYSDSPSKALYHLEKDDYGDLDLIISDLKMPEMDGIEFISRAKKLVPHLPLILMTAHGSIETAVTGIRQGAYDYVIKPLKFAEFSLVLERALKVRQLERENSILRNEVKGPWQLEGILGKSPGMQAIFKVAKQVAQTQSSVMINGESGTGKEVVARMIHNLGNRKDKPFVPLNCASIPEHLLESELFGHAKGSFTGASSKREGLFEEAQGGTIFLDEIGDMEISLQAKLLRVLQERQIKRVGENQYIDIDVRVIAATHRDLKAEVKAGRFREDLYYRLCVIPIMLPPLRERREDIPILADYFLAKYAATVGRTIRSFSKTALARMLDYRWEGNVRELQNVIERAVVLSDGEVIGEEHFPLPDLTKAKADIYLSSEKSEAGKSLLESNGHSHDFQTDFQNMSANFPTLEEFELRYIKHVLAHTGNQWEAAAQILDIHRKTLHRKIKGLEEGQSNPLVS